MIPFILIGAITVSAAVTIIADIRDMKRLRMFAKPLTTILICTLAAIPLMKSPALFAVLIAVGLVLSLGGDIALLSRKESAFMIGLVLFLSAHILYTISFLSLSPFVPADAVTGAVLLIVIAVIYRILWPGLGAMKAPVLVYAVIISFMLLRAVSTVYGGKISLTPAVLIAIGSILFFSSDMILAVNKFRRNNAPDGLPVLSTYFAGQTLIALSLSYMAFLPA